MKTKEELLKQSGTPEDFASAVWMACNDGFCTDAEAYAAIAKYRETWAAAPNACNTPKEEP